MQAETKRFFSPYATWTRIPGASSSSVSGDGDATSSSSSSEDLMKSVGAAVDEYVSTYSNLLNPMGPGSASSTTGPGASAGVNGAMKKDVVEEIINEDFLGEYLAYRTAKDPAKRLLTGE